jgi:hypothetical protein
MRPPPRSVVYGFAAEEKQRIAPCSVLSLQLFRFLRGQRLERNAKPVRRSNAIREQCDVERRIVGQHGVQFRIMRGGRARHVEGGFHCGLGRGRETPAQCNVKDKVKVQVDGIEG